MKQFYALFSLAFLLPAVSPAQDLAANNTPVTKNYTWNTKTDSSISRETPSRKPQQWDREEDQLNGHIGKTQLAKMKNVNEALIAILRDSCISDGTSIWHGEFFSEKTSPGPILKFGVHCNYTANAHLDIMANDLGPLLDHLVVNNTDFLTIRPAMAGHSDCQYFEYETATGKIKYWLVTTAHNQLPYTPLSRKEYLQEARAELKNKRDQIVADLKQKMPIRPLTVQVAEKTATIDQLKNIYSGIDLQVRMRSFLNNYRSDEDYLKENISSGTAGLDSTLHLMDSLSTHLTAAELGKPALVSVAAADFTGFEDNTDGKAMLIKMNTAYFDQNAGVEKPQFFLISWSAGAPEPAITDLNLDKEMGATIDAAVPYLLNILLVTNSSKK
jgi:hypothetical protein